MKQFLVLGFIFAMGAGLLTACSSARTAATLGEAFTPKARGEGKPPVITHSFAVDKGLYGSVWRIYIEAEDPDGDMWRIASVVNMVGYGIYPTSWAYLKSDQGRSIKGYLQWNTYSSAGSDLPEWTEISLGVTVFDRAGNESNQVIFPYTFQMGAPSMHGYKPPPPFDQGDLRLGYINVNLQNPWRGDGRAGARDD